MTANLEPFRMWVVFFNPSDFPGKFVVRVQEIHPDKARLIILPEVWIRDTLEAARACIPPGLYRLDRRATDAPQIVEVWF